MASGDLDGDGAEELIVGAPQSVYFGTGPGSVFLYSSPAPGNYGPSDATVTLVSGSQSPDAFGISLGVGRLDRDDALDLAIGAPRHDVAFPDGGSLTLFSGALLGL